jgi:hypothetical protein
MSVNPIDQQLEAIRQAGAHRMLSEKLLEMRELRELKQYRENLANWRMLIKNSGGTHD